MYYPLQIWIGLGDATNGLLGVGLPVQYLLDISFLLAICIVAILLFILFYLWNLIVTGQRIESLEDKYRTLICEVVISETLEELAAVMDQPAAASIRWNTGNQRLHRKVFTQELLKIRKGVSGKAAENICWLYQALKLHKDAHARLAAAKWHLKAAAIQELAQMGEPETVDLIAPFTNHRNFYVRTEAQVALVKMIGFAGLDFLDSLQHPLTQWQQVCLLQQLSLQTYSDYSKVALWLQSGNDSVVELALRMVEGFQIHAMYTHVLSCLMHTNKNIQKQAARTLAAIEQEDTSELLQQFREDSLLTPESHTIKAEHR